METNLTKEEQLFCELYANGDAPYGGNAVKCYEEAFGESGKNVRSKVMTFLAREDIQQYLDKLEKLSFEETKYMKKFLTRNLVKIVEECASKEYVNRKGIPVSPAGLRAVAVNASKALMDMYPVKEAQRVSIEGNEEGGGIVFNVIMPEDQKKKEQ